MNVLLNALLSSLLCLILLCPAFCSADDTTDKYESYIQDVKNEHSTHSAEEDGGRTENILVGNDSLLDQYISSKGENIILFNNSNIKQFWIDKSVISKTGNFSVELQKKGNRFESIPLKIQLANVSVEQDCEIEVIAETKDIGFFVSNMQSKTISSVPKSAPLGCYQSFSSKFHVENSSDAAFTIIFHAEKSSLINIKTIVLSFSKNEEFLSSRGVLRINKDNSILSGGHFTSSSINAFSIAPTAKSCNIFSKKRILIKGNQLSPSLTIKNTGESPVRVLVGYAPYMQNATKISGKNYPYTDKSRLLKVISSEKNSKSIIVDSYDDWKKDCVLAINTKEDISDIPNSVFADGKIVEVKKQENGYAEIIMDSPQKRALEKGTNVRINGNNGSQTYVYSFIKVLQPGEEETVNATVKRNDTLLLIKNDFLPRGTYYVIPFIYFNYEEQGKSESVQVRDYSISY